MRLVKKIFTSNIMTEVPGDNKEFCLKSKIYLQYLKYIVDERNITICEQF